MIEKGYFFCAGMGRVDKLISSNKVYIDRFFRGCLGVWTSFFVSRKGRNCGMGTRFNFFSLRFL